MPTSIVQYFTSIFYPPSNEQHDKKADHPYIGEALARWYTDPQNEPAISQAIINIFSKYNGKTGSYGRAGAINKVLHTQDIAEKKQGLLQILKSGNWCSTSLNTMIIQALFEQIRIQIADSKDIYPIKKIEKDEGDEEKIDEKKSTTQDNTNSKQKIASLEKSLHELQNLFSIKHNLSKALAKYEGASKETMTTPTLEQAISDILLTTIESINRKSTSTSPSNSS